MKYTLIALIALLPACSMISTIRPSSEVSMLYKNGCDVVQYHHNAVREELDISCYIKDLQTNGTSR
jgi:hypothetical protein